MVQVQAVQRDTGRRLPMTVEPVPDDLSWLGLPPAARSEPVPATKIFLLIDTSASMAGAPLMEAQSAARAFLDKCDFTRTEVGLISFSDAVALQSEATDNARRVHAAINRLEPDGTTNLAEALEMARKHLLEVDLRRYAVMLTDGYPDAADAAVEEANRMKGEGIEVVAIGMGAADLDYLRRIASTEAGSIFARHGELVSTFGQIARMIAEGGRGLRAPT
jgi:Mg-chelatase subunit ChlD